MRTALGATIVTKATLFAAATFVALAGVTAAVVEVSLDGGSGRTPEVLGAQLSGSSSPSSPGGSSNNNGNKPTDPGRPSTTPGIASRFPVSGSIADLVPGDQRTLTVQLTNENPFTVSVNQINVTATAASAQCGVANLSISPLPAPVLVAANASGTAGVPIMLVTTAPDACQGATFPLTFAVEVTKA